MKRNLLIIPTIALFIALLITGCAPPCPEMGSNAPDFTLKNVDGQSVSLSDFKGKIVMLNFWATWCGPCTAEMPHFQSVHKNRSSEELAILAVNINESAPVAKKFVDSRGLSFHFLLDSEGKVAELYCLPQAIPVTLFIDANGIIKARKIGAFRNQGEIESMLDSL